MKLYQHVQVVGDDGLRQDMDIVALSSIEDCPRHNLSISAPDALRTAM